MTALRTSAARLAGEASVRALRRLGRGGTALPGLILQTIDPGWIQEAAGRLTAGSVIITGTNGKTTTARLVAAMAAKAGYLVVHNAAGSNLERGIAASLLSVMGADPQFESPDGRGTAPPVLGVFEVDEASVPALVQHLRPRVVAFTNLFRDQLDRYGEVDAVAGRWRAAIRALDSQALLVLSADDPSVAGLGDGREALTFGLEERNLGHPGLEHAADARWCPRCGGELAYDWSFYGHLGHYRCPFCDFARPTPTVAAEHVRLQGVSGSELRLRAPWGIWEGLVPLPGLYNVMNVLAAVATAQALGIPEGAVREALAGVTAAFGRGEVLDVWSRRVHLMLVKNPVGLSEVVRTIALEQGPLNVAMLLNDGIADGRDVSWIWDADLEPLAGRLHRLVVAGHRAEDLALRLRAAGALPDPEVGRWWLEHGAKAALRRALSVTPPGGRLFVLPTYTALLQSRTLLASWGGAQPFWAEAAAS